MNSAISILLALASLAHAYPQGYGSGASGQQVLPASPPGRGPNLAPGCKVEYKTVSVIEQREEYETKCVDKVRKHCDTKQQRICEPYREQKCNDYTRDVKEEYTEDECKDVKKTVCEKHWIEVSNGYGGVEKEWADDPSTCKDLYETNCYPVQKYRTKKEPYTECNWHTSEKCRNEPYQDCYDVTEPECREIHKQVPYQTSKKIPLRVCNDGSDPYQFNDAEIIEYDLINERSGIDEDFDNEDEDAEIKPEKQKAPSAITFG